MSFNMPWEIARKVIHIGYDYDEDNIPSQYGFLCEISDEDLNTLNKHAVLQRHYDNVKTDDLIDWSDLIKIVVIEQEFRSIV